MSITALMLVRLLVTLLVPFLIEVGATYFMLPGVASDMPRAQHARETLNVFALGTSPFLAACGIVEVAALLVPRWSKLRHTITGRAALTRSAWLLSCGLVSVSAWNVATYIGRVDELSSAAPVTLVVSLLAGAATLLLASMIIGRAGLTNGFVTLFAASLLHRVYDEVRLTISAGYQPDGETALAAGSVVLAALATFVVLGFVHRMPRAETANAPREQGEGGPYRASRALVVHPWIPVPAGSVGALYAATAVLMLPFALGSMVPSLRDLSIAMTRHNMLVQPLSAALVLAFTWLFATLMHRPRDLGDLAARLGADGRSVEEGTRVALRRAIVATLLFFVATTFFVRSRTLSASVLLCTMAVIIDLVTGVRTRIREKDLVGVWNERRAALVPVLREALAAQGIHSEVSGMAELTMFQVFAPYAWATILVPNAEAPRARAVLHHVLLGEDAPGAGTATVPVTLREVPESIARKRIPWLGAIAGAGAAVFSLGQLDLRRTPSGPPVKLEIVRVVDEVDAFAAGASGCPVGCDVLAVNAPVGPGKTQLTHVARMSYEGRSAPLAQRTFEEWAARVPVPPGTHLAFQDSTSPDPDKDDAPPRVTGEETMLLSNEVILGREHVSDAYVIPDQGSDPGYTVAITLTPEGADRFAKATRALVRRRIAIVHDGRVTSAPVVVSEISGGHVSFTMTRHDDLEKQLANAHRLADGLRSQKRR